MESLDKGMNKVNDLSIGQAARSAPVRLKLLVVEDHNDLALNLLDHFTLRGHTVDLASNGTTGLHLATSQRFDAVVLDVMLPGIDGITLCARLRQHERDQGYRTAVLFLTAKDSLENKLVGFEAGGDDYLVKPVALREIEARLIALHARSQAAERQGNVLRLADLTLNLGTLEATRAGQRLALTPSGLRLLEKMMRRAPNVVHREEFEHLLWGDTPPNSDALKMHISALRSVVDKPFAQPLIETVRGFGYRMKSPDA